MTAFDKQVGGNYYKQFKIQPYKFFFENKITHERAAIIRRILRYDQKGGKGLQDLEKIQHECNLLKELQNYKITGETQENKQSQYNIKLLRYLTLLVTEMTSYLNPMCLTNIKVFVSSLYNKGEHIKLYKLPEDLK